MRFDNTPKSDGGSYEKPAPGKFIGLLVGFAYVGIQSGGQHGPKPKVLLRWELHKRRGPSLDSKGFAHTVTARYGATVRGESSLLRKCMEAHGIPLPEGAETDSRDWLGHAAWLDIELSTDDKWANVTGISKLDPDEDTVPTRQLELEHWDPVDGDDGTTLPSWAAWAVARSEDLAHLAPDKAKATKTNGAPTTAAVDDDDDPPF